MFDVKDRLNKLLSAKQELIKDDEITKDQSVQQQSITFFDNIYGLEKEKENIYRALISERQINILLIGPPATAKTLFMDTIKEKCNNVLFYDAANTSKAGLIDDLSLNQKVQIIIIDEISRLKPMDLDAILGLLNNGEINKSVRGKKYKFKLNCKIFATSNNSKLNRAIRSRFQEYHLKEYSDDEFIGTIDFCLKDKILPEVSMIISKVLIAHGIKDVRKAISISALLHKNDSQEDIIRVIENWLDNYSHGDLDYD